MDAMFRSASGATARLAAATLLPHPALHLLPGQSRIGIFPEVRLPACQFLLLPVMNGHIFGSAREVIPEIFNELKLFGRAQMKDR